MCLCDFEALIIRRPWPTMGCSAMEETFKCNELSQLNVKIGRVA